MRFLALSVAALALSALVAAPAGAASAAPPTGCRAWVERDSAGALSTGVAQCDTGRYKVRVECRDYASTSRWVVFGWEVPAPWRSEGYCSGRTAYAHSAETVPRS
ncbi:hypothetical protein [Nonomuraea typhae]|uniref:hypothetical protein n=1 Tax=Nonomuraea typhae TaxID=2603600 RepID=UPI0012F83FCD|nr:hypothetical protein [Nonomuraea typhae]